MTSRFYDRAQMNTATLGAGAVTLSTATTGYQTFAAAGVVNGLALTLLILDSYVAGVPSAWEISTSVYTAAGTSCTRVLRSSSTGSLLVLSGSATVAVICASAELDNFPLLNTANTFTATQTITPAANTNSLVLTGSGAASIAALHLTGDPFTGGNGTTRFPLVLMQPPGATPSTSWQTSGTYLGINADSSSAYFFDGKYNGVSKIIMQANGSFYAQYFQLLSGAGAGLSYLQGPADGVITLIDTSGANFNRLQLGGTSASYPALKRSSATIAFRLADDSADAAITTAGITASNSLTFSAAATGPILKQGANGSVGTFVANGASAVTVNNTNIAITDAIIISLNTAGGTVGAIPAVKTITAATGFTVAGTTSDTSTYNYAIIKNAA